MASRAGQRQRGGREAVTERVAGGLARLEPDPDRPRGWTLTLDGAPQSSVDLADPTHLGFAYQRRIGHAADVAVAPAPGSPLRAVHLGGGALSLPRYVAATRPRSTQQVVEVDRELTAFVRRALPWDAGQRIRVRGADARAGLAKVPDGWADLVVADVFDGARTPAHLGTVEFLTDVRRALDPDGLYVVNVTDGPPLAHLRAQIATVLAVFPEVCVTADPAVLRGRRFGNAVLLAAARPLPVAELTRRAAADPHPARLEHGRALADFTGGARPVTDATARPSPPPPPGTFA
ncbi:spermidine synthase [Streptomyces sp. GSL17-111]|uniref:spermidine synthase n=1 Tax=Streptomyces sp. GSL17-111 TaxID=3121596 RepID=UPI0030F4403B